ncbi:hypothetical protein AVEN_149371-1 [Araneus ventricosus]|uniref:Uncharacterized protein n=1 Tax=Araneus ventricosus TaxID=182803 RepID=A0A4Y2V5D0_ARAVE|nr:hypothetical protein AVEN_149371-1 [Araneus ventricosus]
MTLKTATGERAKIQENLTINQMDQKIQHIVYVSDSTDSLYSQPGFLQNLNLNMTGEGARTGSENNFFVFFRYVHNFKNAHTLMERMFSLDDSSNLSQLRKKFRTGNNIFCETNRTLSNGR